jgi:hypothetical protein
MPRLSREGGNPQVTIDAGSSYELLMSLQVVFDVDNHPIAEVGPDWLSAIQERAGKALMDRLHAFTQDNGDFFVHLVPLAYDAPGPRTTASLLTHLETVDARDLLMLMVGYYDYHMRRTTPPEVIRAAVDGDPAAKRELLEACEGWPDWQGFLSHLLARDPQAVKSELIALLGEWNEQVWQADEERILPILVRDADAKRALASELPFERFVETATNGVQFVPHAGIDRLVLIPSWAQRPWVSYAEYGGAMFLVYPVADENLSAERDAPPLRLVRLTKALGDEKRLRILRALAAGPRSLVELTEQFEVPKTTMHHHLVTLRSAGLVSVGTGSKDYRLRADVLPNLAQMLGGYLGPVADQDTRRPPEEQPAGLPVAASARRRGRRPGAVAIVSRSSRRAG